MPFNVNFKDDTREKIEAGGVTPPPGYYLAEVLDTNADSKSDAQVFEYKITHGAYEGRVVYDRLFSPDGGKDDKAIRLLTNRVKTICGRLGIVMDEWLGQDREVDLQEKFLDCIGKPVVIKVTNEEYPVGSGKMNARIDFAGVWGLESPSLPADVRAKLGLPELAEHKAAREEMEKNGGKKPRATRKKAEAVTADSPLHNAAEPAKPKIDTSDL